MTFRHLVRTLCIVGLLAANYSIPATAKPTCWECETCSNGACCPGTPIGHTDCTSNGSSCTVGPENCPS